MLSCKILKASGRIAIIGGGPAGLILARLLQMRGFAVKVYERDASRAARPQGGSLDLHTNSGQRALAAAGLMDAFRRYSRLAGQAFKVVSKDGKLRYAVTAEEEGASKPEIDRGDLRELLLDSLKDNTVQWDHTLEGLSLGEGGSPVLSFHNKPTIQADLVIGCDGFRSKVREQLSSTQPMYVGLTMFENVLKPELWRNSELATLVGEGAVLMIGGGRGVWAQRNSSGALRIYFSLPVARTWPEDQGVSLSDQDEALELILQQYQDWSPVLVNMLTPIAGVFNRWPLYALPPGHTWISQPGLSMLGDAAHVMPPFTGKGANMALLDALELANELTSDPTRSAATAVQCFEKKMQLRMQQFVSECLQRMQETYGVDLNFEDEPRVLQKFTSEGSIEKSAAHPS